MSVLEELSVKHPYYCSESNYYINDASATYKTMTEFLDDFELCDIDMNLCFRWDIKKDDSGKFSAEVFIIQQRKGIFKPVSICSVTEEEAERFKSYALRHLEVMKSIWSPLW